MPPYRFDNSSARTRHYGNDFGGGSSVVLFATQTSGAIFASFDGGLSWALANTAPAGVFFMVFSEDLNRAVAFCAGGVVNRYTEDGITFQNGTQPGAVGWQRGAFGGPVGDRRFIIVDPANTAANKVAWSPTGIGAWTFVNFPSNRTGGCVLWDESRQLWLYAGYTFAGEFAPLTSPTGDVWTPVFTSPILGGAAHRLAQPAPGGRTLYANVSATPAYYSDDALFAVWTQDEGLECPAIAASPTLWAKCGPGAPFPGPMRTSPTAGLGTWTSSTAPFFPGSQDGIYVPQLEKFFWMSTGNGIYSADIPAGAASWTQHNADPNFNGSFCIAPFAT